MTRQQKRFLERKQQKNTFRGKIINLNVIAYLHNADGSFEVAAFKSECPEKAWNSKDSLLFHITKQGWGHNPPTSLIAEYLLQTQAYKLSKRMNKVGGYEVHFYKKGADKSNPESYSCRQIHFYDTEKDFDNALEICNKALEKMNMDIRSEVW